MLRGTDERCVVVAVGDSFEMKMNRMGRDYCMINYVVEFERDRKIFWEPSPGDVDTAGGDPSKIGVPSGYCWGFELRSESDVVTVVTHIFQCGSDENSWILQNEGGKWINGRNSVVESMEASLLKLEAICTN